jgi:two-component system sensor histidine kinase AlgZ
MKSDLSALLLASQRYATAEPQPDNLAAIPFWMPVLAALPVGLCLTVLGLPDVSASGHGLAFRILYGAAFLAWIFPVAMLQRAMWRTQRHWAWSALLLLLATYAMSVVNGMLGNILGHHYHPERSLRFDDLFSGLDGCWLALISFCALHAVVAYYAALGQARQRLVAARAEAREARLNALRYQLHPHFLFNTLNAVSALVATQRNDDATRVIAQLAEFLRATLAHDDTHEHALADELALTECYLAIEQARLGERLAVDIRIGPSLLDAQVPFLLLQPLAENAIRHGIAQRTAPGLLTIDISRQASHLAVAITNDLANKVEPTGQFGIGLRNLADRLRTLYGDAQRFSMGVVDGTCYRVNIELPYRPAVEPSSKMPCQ